MSDTSDQEKTEKPTPRRLRKSREEGQIPRSRELGNAITLLVGSLMLKLMAGQAGVLLTQMIRYNFDLERAVIFDTNTLLRHLLNSVSLLAPAGLLLFGVIMLAGILGQIMVGGWLFSGKMLMPKANRLSPSQWVGKVFSSRGLLELVKSILKILLVVGCLVGLLWTRYSVLLNLSSLTVNAALLSGLQVLADALFYYALALVLIAAIDVPFQLWSHHKKLRMTRQEIKDEHKDTEGRPEIKQKVRQIQREMAQQRMMQRIPQADVIIVNPSHYAVALKYDLQRAQAPFVLAKGVDELALKIREAGQHHRIQVVEAPLLTRAVYYSTRIDQQIPDDLYLAVAQVLAYTYQLSQFQKGQSKTRPVMPDLEVPDDYDSGGKRRQ